MTMTETEFLQEAGVGDVGPSAEQQLKALAAFLRAHGYHEAAAVADGLIGLLSDDMGDWE